MKKYIGSIILSLIVGVYLGKFMLNQYDDLTVSPVSSESSTLYFLETGIYSDLDSMKNSMTTFPYYVYEELEDGLHTYVGITKNEKNAGKVKEYLDDIGYDINIREFNGFDESFVSIVSQYDILLESASGEGITDICGQILSSYEELVLNGT